MGWFSRKKTEQRDGPTYSVSDPALLGVIFGGNVAATGISVTVERALTVPAVWCATEFLSGAFASLPLDLYRRNGDDREAVSNDLANILSTTVNADLVTSYQWRKLSFENVLLYGRAFTFIERNKAGRVMNLWPLDPRNVTVTRVNGRRSYTYKEGSATFTYDSADIIDVPWKLKPDGLCHYDPVAQFKNAIGLALALEAYASRFFENGGIPPLALHGPMPTGAGVKRAAEDIQAGLRTAQNERRNVLVLPGGHELKPIGVDPAAGQMEQARQAQLGEFSRWFGLPPVFLHDLSRATFTNSEQQDLQFVKHALMKWLECWEQELNAKLFPPRNTRNFVEFNQDALLRGDFKSRMEGYAQGVQNGFLTPDEVRAMENRPAKGGDADKLHVQGATVPMGSQPQLQKPTPTTTTPQEGGDVQA